MTQTIQPPTVQLFKIGEESNGKTPCALRLEAPADVERVPTHFVLLLDISESMLDNGKLNNCKTCANLMLNFMVPQDKISLITFGETARLHLSRVPADEQHKDAIKATVQSIQADGCTNLSAGLGYVRQVCEGDTQKAGLLILTDGHANRGVSSAPELRNIVKSLRESYSNLSIHCVAYGVDHNADLLQNIAQDNQGSYNIVNSIEDTAFAFGDTLGGLMSCAYQNVGIQIPEGTVVQGPHTMVKENGVQVLRMGDIYAGNKPVVLFSLPTDTLSVTVQGMSLPMLDSWTIPVTAVTPTERDRDIELTQLRYDCTDLLAGVRRCSGGNSVLLAELHGRLTAFETKVNDAFYNGHPVAELLRSEVSLMRSILDNAQTGRLQAAAVAATTSQHMTSLTMARGFSSPMGAHRGPRTRRHAPEDPANQSDEEPEGLAATTSCFQNRVQQRIASLMATQSQGGNVENEENVNIINNTTPNLNAVIPQIQTLGPS